MIINQTVSGGSTPAQVPNYYKKLAVNQSGELEYDSSQTVFSTAPATDIAIDMLFQDAFCNPNDPNEPPFPNLQTINLDSLTNITAEDVFTSACFGIRTVTSFSAANLTTIDGGNAFNACFYGVDNDAAANFVSAFSFPALTDVYGAYAFGETWSNNARVVSISFPLLEYVGTNCFASACSSSPRVSSASFPSLTYIDAGAFALAFSNISPTSYNEPTHTLTLTFGGTDPIDFGGNVDCFDGMLDGTDIDVTINAPLASQSDFEQMTGYPDFGCTGTVTWNWQS